MSKELLRLLLTKTFFISALKFLHFNFSGTLLEKYFPSRDLRISVPTSIARYQLTLSSVQISTVENETSSYGSVSIMSDLNTLYQPYLNNYMVPLRTGNFRCVLYFE